MCNVNIFDKQLAKIMLMEKEMFVYQLQWYLAIACVNYLSIL